MENTDRQLRYFVKIAELGSLSRAADALDLTQSGISRQLASLETYVGKPLFSRTGRGVELTRAGEKLFDVAKAAYVSIDDALESVRDKEGVTQGHIRIAVIHTLSYYFMSDVVAEFMVQRESVNLSLISRSSPEVVALVESGKADIGFVYDSAVDSAEFQATPLFEDEMCIIAREDSVWPDEIDLTTSRCRLVGFPLHYALRKMLQSGGLTPEFVAEADTIDAMLKLVSSGVGACVLPTRIRTDCSSIMVSRSLGSFDRHCAAVSSQSCATTSIALRWCRKSLRSRSQKCYSAPPVVLRDQQNGD